MILSKKLKKYKFVSHGFFGLKGGVSKGVYKTLNCGHGSYDKKNNIKKNINIVSKKIGCKSNKIIINHQIHSKKIYFFKKIQKRKFKGDGILTETKKLAIAVLTADCAPVMVIDKKRKIIGIIHAGWKGAFKGIIKNILSSFIKKGSNKKDLVVVIGPTIGQKSYEVKKDFKTKFLKKNMNNKNFFINRNNKILFDLQGYIIDQFNSNGIKDIEVIKKDTFDKKNNFFSARRSLKQGLNDYGRNISIIMIK